MSHRFLSPVRLALWLLIGAIGSAGCAPAPHRSENAPGGRLAVTYRTEPSSFNRLVRPEAAVELVSRLTQASLVRLNRATRPVEPWLAPSMDDRRRTA